MRRKLGETLCSLLVTMSMILGLIPGISLTAYAAPTEELLTTITATGQEQASYSTENVATISFSYTASGASSYYAKWGWWGYGWIATVTPADGYTITKCVFYDDSNRTATDSEAPFVVETTEGDKTPQVNGAPILANWSKGITKIEVYGYATAQTYTVTYSVVNGTWSDRTTANITESVQSGSTPASVPSGMIAGSGFTGGSWDTDPASATITGNITFTYTFEAESVDPDPDTPTPDPVTPDPEPVTPSDTPAPVITPEQAREMTIRHFVERIYLIALNRSYDVTGRDYWVDQIINKDASGSAIARGFFNSQEFIARELDNEEFVNTLYRVFFDREPDTQGFTNWINALENGATRSEVINEFAGSTEWTSMCARFGINA